MISVFPYQGLASGTRRSSGGSGDGGEGGGREGGRGEESLQFVE